MIQCSRTQDKSFLSSIQWKAEKHITNDVICKNIFSHYILHCFSITFLRDKIYLEKYCCEKLCVDSCCSDGFGRFTFFIRTKSSPWFLLSGLDINHCLKSSHLWQYEVYSRYSIGKEKSFSVELIGFHCQEFVLNKELQRRGK